jgi:hypothetical protein
LEVLGSKRGSFWFGAWGDVNLLVWLQPATLEAVARLDRIAEQQDQTQRKRSTVHVLTSEAGPPDNAAREALVELHSKRTGNVACAGVIIERTGLMGMAVRSAVTGLIILAPKHFRIKVFDTIDQCSPWIAEQHERVTGGPLSAAELGEAMRKARSLAIEP